MGCCQVVAVYNEAQQGGARLHGLRFREWEYREERIPADIRKLAAEFLSTRRFVGAASGSAGMHDPDSKRGVIPNVLIIWYLDQVSSSSRPVLCEVGHAASAATAGDAAAAWIRASGLRRSDLLAVTVHPLRAAGAQAGVGDEACEWLAFHHGRGHGGALLSRARCHVWEGRRCWKWYFDRLTESEDVMALSLVAFTTTCLCRHGYVECAQLALWQPADSDPGSGSSQGCSDVCFDDLVVDLEPRVVCSTESTSQGSPGMSRAPTATPSSSLQPAKSPTPELSEIPFQKAAIASHGSSLSADKLDDLGIYQFFFDNEMTKALAVTPLAVAEEATARRPSSGRQRSFSLLQGPMVPATMRHVQEARTALVGFLQHQIYPTVVSRLTTQELLTPMYACSIHGAYRCVATMMCRIYSRALVKVSKRPCRAYRDGV